MVIGAEVSTADRKETLARARARAASIPDLLVEAERVVNTVMNGWHGRRKRGPGENFWQFRPYVQGESLARIDWRRSARDDHTYVRDREWESAHTVWLWCDFSPSMLYRSRLAAVSKEARALVLTLALAEILSRSGERIAFPALMPPFSARNGAERLASALMHGTPDAALPDITQIRRFSEVVLVSDFLHPFDEVTDLLNRLAQRGVRAHLVEVADPAEETFPYLGRTEFRDPETGATLIAGRAETYAQDYRRLYIARRETLIDICKRLGWSYTVHRTDRPATEALARLHDALSASGTLSVSLPEQGGASA
ncbi:MULTISPECIES: DUF58 domain-containing protein [unclassified Brucella]|uniref:DUF58 domain-containing protein n=1 Tax=unclassified Brucella TaxID=2632610 RepID=UPI0009728210|nr:MULTISPECIES: DUF58 domain-containing protein [unclassified Brucella]APX70324.1 hypothetical protein BKD03_14030 [Brucella sp. 09RB8471]MRN79519.1 DUF58 domain-containing protein [Brucella sp. 10RB9210]